MYKLFIDTHDKEIVYCLYDGDTVLDKVIVESGRRHGDTAMPTLDSLLNKNNIKVNSLSEIIVVTGPGSFTGVRIGVTIGKMLSYTLNIPIKTITSLELLSISYPNEKVIITIRDQKGVYAGLFDDSKLVGDLFYMNTCEFEDFLKSEKDYSLKENNEINFEKLGEKINSLESINVHLVKPCYVKVIEALK